MRVLRGLQLSGIERVAVVLGHQADQIRSTLEGMPSLGVDLHFVINRQYEKSNGVSLLAAREYVGEECVLSMADHLYSPRVVSAVLADDFPTGSCVLGVDYDIPSCFDIDDATKVRVARGRVVAISKTLTRYDALDTGVFRVGPAMVEELATIHRERGDCSLSDGVQALSNQGCFFASDVRGAPWVDVDTPEAARHAARMIRDLGDDLEGNRRSAPLPSLAFAGTSWGAPATVPSMPPARHLTDSTSDAE